MGFGKIWAEAIPISIGSLLGFGSGRSFSIWLFVLIFIFGNNIGQRFRADDFQIPKLRQSLAVACKPSALPKLKLIMDVKIWINELEFSDNSKIKFDKNDIVVFVGSNNAGKSASLKEAATLLQTKNNQGKVILTLNLSKEGDENDLITFLETFSQKEFNTNPLPFYKGLGFSIYESNAKTYWNESNGISELVKVFANVLSTEDRLGASNPADNIKLTVDAPQHPIHFLQKNDNIEKQFSSYFRLAFGLDLIVHRNAGREVPLYIGNIPMIKEGEDRLSESYQVELEKLDLLHKQGDGMRSFVGVLLNSFVGYQNILFIDEPEAFLHPPQARLLGKMLAKDLPNGKQLFLATHSTDFLKGLLDSNNKNLKIIRIQREANINKVSVLDNTEINSIWSDSLLRHSNILDGLFHTQVVICESDSDCRFYSAILSAINEKSGTLSPDILFIHCGGKHRIPTVIKALKKLNVTIKIVTDFDVLNDINPLKDIYEQSGGLWNDILIDWQKVKASVDAKKPELETKELKDEIDKIFSSTTEKIIPKEKITAVQKTLKKASAWAYAKEVGKIFIPSGDATQAYERLQKKLKENGIFIVETGELESFCKSIGNHGPKWVNEVLIKDLVNDSELISARNFVSEFTK